MTLQTTPEPPTVAVITVTHNSGPFFDRFLQSIAAQTQPPTRILIVDSGSSDNAFLRTVPPTVEVLRCGNLGFAAGCNLAWRRARDLDFTLFLNPDAFLPPDFLARATAFLQGNPTVGMLAPTLLRFDLAAGHPLPLVDTTGVVRNRLGLLVERDSNQPLEVLARYTAPNPVPWLCAAVLLARREALESVVFPRPATPPQPGPPPYLQLFDEVFFMYKEDTDLTWRVRRAGWQLVHHPGLVAYHCRGWQHRRTMPRRMRLLSARNEVRMCRKARSPFVLLALAKYLAVLLFNV